MGQWTTGPNARGVTPGFLLCTNSDTEFKKARLIETLLTRGVWLIGDFEHQTELVSIFFSLIDVRDIQPIRTGFQPSEGGSGLQPS